MFMVCGHAVLNCCDFLHTYLRYRVTGTAESGFSWYQAIEFLTNVDQSSQSRTRIHVHDEAQRHGLEVMKK